MAPKKATGAAAVVSKAKKPASGDAHPTYKEMIKEAIITLKERNGSSRQSIKKYILSNKGVADDKQFASQLNRALRSGVEKGEFAQPKGPSGPVKIAHKETAKKASPPKESAAKKDTKPKTDTKKKTSTTPATKKTATKPAAVKKTSTKKTTTAKPKATANTSSKRKTAPASAPAVVDKPTTLTKTKSGRVAKTTATATKKSPAKRAAPKKAAPKKTEAKAEA